MKTVKRFFQLTCAAAVVAAEHLCQCAKCSCNFDKSKAKSSDAGCECPNCGTLLDEKGACKVKDQAAKEKANDGKEIIAATDAGAEAGLDASNPAGINQYTERANAATEKANASGKPEDHFSAAAAHRAAADQHDRKNQSLADKHSWSASQHEAIARGLQSGKVSQVSARNATRQPALEAGGPGSGPHKSGNDLHFDAMKASGRAAFMGGNEAHEIAQKLHEKAAEQYGKEGETGLQKYHESSAKEHADAIKSGNTKPTEMGIKYLHTAAAKASNATPVASLQAGYNGNQHQSSKELAAEHSVAADTASKVAASASKAARNQDPSNKEGMHDHALTMHAAAKSLHELAAQKHRSAGEEDCAKDHDTAAAGHGNEMQAHKGVIEACGGMVAKATQAATAAALASDATPAAGLQLDCSACVEAKNFKSVLNPIADGILMYMPAGTHEITPSQNGRPVTVTVAIDAAAADRLESQRRSLEASGKKPFFSVQHSTQIAAFWPAEFFWDTRLDATGSLVEGVWARGEWTRAGRDAVEGKDFRTFSPTFFVDAIRNDPNRPVQVVCNDEAKANMGALENDAAFQKISPLWAHDASAAGTPKQKPAGVTTERLIVMVHDELRASNPDLQDVVNALSFKYDMRVSSNDVARALRGEALEAGGPGSGPHKGGGKEEAESASKKANDATWNVMTNGGDEKEAAKLHEAAASAHEKSGDNPKAVAYHKQSAAWHRGESNKGPNP